MRNLVIWILIIGGLIVGGFMYVKKENPHSLTNISFGETYENNRFGFNVKVPEGFTVTEYATEGSDVIVFQNDKEEGIQVIISQFSDIKILTASMVKEGVPDITVTDVETIEVGDVHKGVAFKSDNPEFGGASREVWFVFDGYLYQISTYERLDDLLRAMFSTWNFVRN